VSGPDATAFRHDQTDDDSRRDVAEMLERWAKHLRTGQTDSSDRAVEREQKRARRFFSEERFRDVRKRCRLRELPLPAILPGVEEVCVPLSAIHEETGHTNHAEMAYVVAAVRHRRATRIFEFGTFLGRTTYHLAALNPEAHVWTLDLPREENRWWFAGYVGSYFHGTPVEDRITMLRQNAYQFDPAPFTQSMDFIWVDGDHSYNGVRNDTEKAFAMLAPGGAIMWHDFGHESLDLVDYIAELTGQQPLFWIRRTSLLLHIDGLNPLEFEAYPVPFSKAIFKNAGA
jgi:predicted O-methyltransferase YrrM